MTDEKFDSVLRKQIATLPKERVPQRDLWPGIELALAAKVDVVIAPSKSFPRWYAVAASVALVSLIGWLSVAPTPQQMTGQQLVTALSNQHQMQLDSLLVSYKAQPALTSNWKEQLHELDDASAAIKQALAHDPDNAALLRMLQNVYQQQIELIERVHAPKWQTI